MFITVRTDDGRFERIETIRHRTKCTLCRHSSTCYEAGHYPHRQFQLDVVADVVAQMAFGESSSREAAAPAKASPSSARRWEAWVANLAQPADLLQVAAELEREAPATPGTSTLPETKGQRRRVARVLDALERLGAVLIRGGRKLGARSGLGQVLEWQHRTHGEVVGLLVQFATPLFQSPSLVRGALPNTG